MIILSNHGILQSQQASISTTETFLIGGNQYAWGTSTKRNYVRVNSDGSLDTSFNAGYGPNLPLNTPPGGPVAKDSAGNYYLAGSFTSYDGILCNRIVKISSAGVVDTTFITNIGTGFNNNVLSLTVDSSDNLYVGGAFVLFNGVAANRIIKLNSNGTKDTSFDNSTGFNNAVFTIRLDSAGKLYVGGQFTTYKSVAALGIIKLNTDGTKDTSFNNSTGFSSGNAVYNIQFDSAGKLYVGGAFTTYKAVAANRIIKLNTDGTKDTSFDNSTGFNNSVYSIAVDSSDEIYVAGLFTTYKGVTENRIVKINTDGSRDSSFVSGTGLNSASYGTVIDTNGKIYVSGGFNSYNGVSDNPGIIRLNTDGSKDTGFDNSNAFFVALINPFSIFKDDSNKIILYGTFLAYKSAELSITSIDKNGVNSGTTFGQIKSGGSLGQIYAIAKDSSNNYYFGGNITQYNGVASQYIMKISSTGVQDTTFTANITPGANNAVYSIAVDSSDKVFVGGQFTNFNSISNPRFIKLNSDGTKDTSFTTGGMGNGVVYDIKLDASTGKIYAAGSFTLYTISVSRMIRINSDGSLDTTFAYSSTFDATVSTMALDSAGQIYAGGNFSNFSGAANNCIIKLNTDGTKDTSFDNSTGFNGQVACIAIDSAGKLYVGGSFTTYKGVAANRIIKLNTDGTKDTSFDNSTGFAAQLTGNVGVQTIEFDSEGKIYVGVINTASATTYKGSIFGSVIKLNTDGSIDTSFSSVPGTSYNINKILKIS